MTFFPSHEFFLIAGPCVIQDETTHLEIAEALASLAHKVPGGITFKASFDKANRSNAGALRGPGMDSGLAALSAVKTATGLPLLTDVHETHQCAPAAEVVDILQIPAFLCRQTDLLEAAGNTGKAVNIKKGQWLHPEGMKGAVDKVKLAGSTDIAVTERGSFFGYGDLTVDMRSFMRMKAATGCPVIFDATHSVQRPGMGEGGASGGAREYIPSLALAAIAAGADGVFLETHPRPHESPSDGPNMLPLNELSGLIDKMVDLYNLVRSD